MHPSTRTSSPRMTDGKGCWPSPTPSPQPMCRQHINPSFPLTLNLASAATPKGTSSAASPATLSLQSSPEGPRGRNIPFDSSPAPLHLPDSTLDTPPPKLHNSMGDAIAMSKSPGLLRKLSRGAANRLRRRPSSKHVSSRDRSSGPVMLRRRSDSKNGVEPDVDVIDKDFEADIEDVQEDPEPVQGLGLSVDGLGLGNGGTSLKSSLTKGGIAPIVPRRLQQGTPLTKVTRRKRKDLNFVLNTDSAKVTWDSSNASCQFYIDDIQQIRLQSDAKNYREECGVGLDCESRWFTIIYADPNRAKGRPVKTMHLIAPSQVVFELWTSTLDDLQRYRHELIDGVAGSRLKEKTLRGHWRCEMARLFTGAPHRDEEENLDFAGVENLCHSFHIHCSKNMLRAQFEKADTHKTGYLNFDEFKDFIRRLKTRTDVKDIYKLINPNNEGLPLDAFLTFLQKIQGINVDANRPRWVKVFNKYARQANKGLTIQDTTDDSSVQMSFASFSEFLCSHDNNIQDFKVPEVKFDKPLNEYFISSSHNTYLLGWQVAGSSSTEPYIRALQRACRCVEIDCWDGQDGRPVVVHGHTMTSSVLFADCISVIGKYAFESSPYPLILSLEVHCNPEQQQVMVDIMIKELGEQLVREPLISPSYILPSPEDLRNRILVKVKAAQESNVNLDLPTVRRDVQGRRDRSFSSPFSRPQIIDNAVIPNTPILSSNPSMSPPGDGTRWGPRSSMTTTSVSSASEMESDTGRNVIGRSKRGGSVKQHKSKIIKSLGDLGVYTRGFKFQSFGLPESKGYNHVFSLAEGRFKSLCDKADTKAQLEKHNMRYLMRVYPGGHRWQSTNPDPLVFWRRGVQMMALNWQTYDLPMQMNDAMFASGSDKLGYVLKPRELRESLSIEEEISEPSIHGLGKLQKKLIRFSVDIVSAQQLPRPRGVAPDATLDPYVEIEMFSAEDKAKGVASGEGGSDASARNGMSGIGSPHRRRTHVVQANGFNPIFNDSFKLSLETKYPSLVFVRWTVWNSPDGRNFISNANADPLATFTAKLSSLEQGYRHLRLYDHNGDQFNCATLFCRIRKEDPVTINREDPVPEKTGGGFKNTIKKAVFPRTRSVEKKTRRQTERTRTSTASSINRSTSKSTSGEKSSLDGGRD